MAPKKGKGKKPFSYGGYANKYAKKAYKKGVKHVYNRYGSAAGIGQLMADVAMLKTLVNAEKKTFEMNTSAGAISVGQVSGNANGNYAFDLTPIPAQGTTSITRNGNSIKLHSSFIRIQLSQMASATNPIRLKFQIVLVKGQPQSVGTFLSTMYNANPFITGASIYDFNSSSNPDYFGTYQILNTKTVKLKEDNYSGQNQIVDINMPMKYFNGKGHHVRFAADGSQTVADGQLIMVVTADNGNISGSTACTLGGVPVGGTAVNTGCYVNYNIVHYFYDN